MWLLVYVGTARRNYGTQFWWPTNQSHNIPLYLKPPFPPMDNFIFLLARYSLLKLRHNECGSVSNQQRLHCLLKCWLRCRLKKTWKLRFTGLCAGNPPVIGEYPAQKASNAENVSIWWCHSNDSTARGVPSWSLSKSYSLVQSAVIDSELWPPNSNGWWLVKKLFQFVCHFLQCIM